MAEKFSFELRRIKKKYLVCLCDVWREELVVSVQYYYDQSFTILEKNYSEMGE